ncbi:Zinc/iron permease [Spinellus fusiger]|nr:Zinc/iron permease [Spinellus fusiger]
MDLFLMDTTDLLQGWLMVAISSIACTTGAAIVFVDTFWKTQHGSLLENRSFLSGSMALASGVLLFSSLSVLLPEACELLGSSLHAYLCFFVGVGLTLALTRVVHWYTPHAIHACGSAEETVYSHAAYSHAAAVDSRDSVDSPSTAPTYGTLTTDTHFCFHPPPTTTTTTTTAAAHSHNHSPTPYRLEHGLDHRKDYYSIGLQTAIAITFHKFPEGLVLFISSQSSSLGLSVCLAMSIHNFTDGLMMALPLYYATHSRQRAFVYAAVLGGFSQPLGALMGLVVLQHTPPDSLFGMTFGIVSGMMSLIAIQSMLPQAIKADASQVVLYFFIGLCLVALSLLLNKH